MRGAGVYVGERVRQAERKILVEEEFQRKLKGRGRT